MSRQPDSNQVTHPFLVAQQAAWIGAGSAVPGLIVGSIYGTLRTQTPTLFALASSAQWAAIGSTFWAVRSSILNRDGLQNWYNLTRGAPVSPRQDLDPSLSDRVRASTIAGAFTGFALGFLFRGPRNVIPGTLMFSIFGWGGQHAYNFLDQKKSEAVNKEQKMAERGEVKVPLMVRIAKSKWTPMDILSDDEYQKMMDEKLLAVEADIALIDEKIEGLKKKQKEIDAAKLKESPKEGVEKK